MCQSIIVSIKKKKRCNFKMPLVNKKAENLFLKKGQLRTLDKSNPPKSLSIGPCWVIWVFFFGPIKKTPTQAHFLGPFRKRTT